MISHDHQAIFIHIPKCAGTSIEAALGHFDQYSGRGRQDHRTIRHLETPINFRAFMTGDNCRILSSRLKMLVHKPKNPLNALTVTAEQFEKYYKFTVVRDPWSRVYSWYRNVQRDEIHLASYGGPMQFADFVQKYAGRGALSPIDYWIKRFNGANPLNKIAHFSRFHNDLLEIAKEADLPALTRLPHELDSRDHIDLRSVYSDDLAYLIARIYADEIRTFGFVFPD